MKRWFTWPRLLAAVLGAVGGGVLLAWQLQKDNPAAMQRWMKTLALGFGQKMGALSALVPFSLAEVCWTAAILGLLVFIVRTVWLLVRRPGRRLSTLAWRLAGLGCAALFVQAGYTAFWGVGYRAPAFYPSAPEVSTEQLERTALLFAEGANRYAQAVERDENSVFSQDLAPLFADTDLLYQNLEAEYPSLSGPVRRAKPMFYSPIMSAIGFTGFYFPFTGEANVNVHSPGCMVPATIAHELAHQRGVVFEDEANFTGIAACLTGEAENIEIFRYSACMMGYLYLSNALYTADYEAWARVDSVLEEGPRADFADNNAFWAQYDSPVSDAAGGVYEGFLQSHGEERGMQSYGACVDLLVQWAQGRDAL